ncbi:hypothetical protein [Leptolyngbya sp. BC1307]|uniref:hypothetical protein n=1 Tax=Leptolyngbya sp. BC1307 TaxID=2029589 RepID=UPI000EFC696E|nr:hypothetical protein [Leptolyngbya sp. BC1307]
MSDVDPSFGRDADLHQYATSDLSVEEQLASGASVDDLVAAGVLYDDYDPDNDPDYDFTPLEPVEEIPEGPPMSDEEFQASLAGARWCMEVHRLGKDAPPNPHIYEFKKPL